MPYDFAAKIPKAYPRMILCALVISLIAMKGRALDFPSTHFEKIGDEYRLTVGAYPLHYFNFRHSMDLRRFSTIGIALGTPSPIFSFTPPPDALRGFFVAEAIDGWSPGDADSDGLDDLWELNHGLNPLDAADAGLPSPLQVGMTHLDYYRSYFGLTRITEYYSAETSVINRPFAISAEISLYNFPNFTGASIEALSSETSVYNFPVTTGASIEALSAELSIFNTPAFTGAGIQALSEEISLFNAPVFAGPSVEAISAEVTIFNTPPFVGPSIEAVSPEVSVFNSFVITPTLQAVSIEVSVLKTTP